MANFLMLLNIMICLPSLVVCFVGMQYDESLPITLILYYTYRKETCIERYSMTLKTIF